MTGDAVRVACDLATRLPRSDLVALARASGGGRGAVEALRAQATTGVVRDACDQLRDILGTCPADRLAGTLDGAASMAARAAIGSSVDVVWTGPSSTVTTSRLTAAVVVELIDDAREEVLLVSFAAQTEAAIDRSLSAASARGVDVTLLLERHADNPHYAPAATPFPSLSARR